MVDISSRLSSRGSLPIVHLNGGPGHPYVGVPPKMMGLEMGANAYITKPFGTQDLLEQVEALLV